MNVNPCKVCGEIPEGCKQHFIGNLHIFCENECKKYGPTVIWYGSEQRAIDAWNEENSLLDVHLSASKPLKP